MMLNTFIHMDCPNSNGWTGESRGELEQKILMKNYNLQLFHTHYDVIHSHK